VGVGWSVEEVGEGVKAATAEVLEARRIYDPSSPGASSQGRVFGDGMTPEQRSDVVEDLKIL
jgi:hypothetical protein